MNSLNVVAKNMQQEDFQHIIAEHLKHLGAKYAIFSRQTGIRIIEKHIERALTDQEKELFNASFESVSEEDWI